LRRIDSGAAGGVDQFVKSIIRYLIIQMYWFAVVLIYTICSISPVKSWFCRFWRLWLYFDLICL
jgi:hypothetical protein